LLSYTDRVAYLIPYQKPNLIVHLVVHQQQQFPEGTSYTHTYIPITNKEATMAITKSSLLPTTLKGAQDEAIGEQDEAKKVGQAMRVHLVQELTKEMQEHTKNGKAQAVLGQKPVCLR
jgi:hypothetical protein